MQLTPALKRTILTVFACIFLPIVANAETQVVEGNIAQSGDLQIKVADTGAMAFNRSNGSIWQNQGFGSTGTQTKFSILIDANIGYCLGEQIDGVVTNPSLSGPQNTSIATGYNPSLTDGVVTPLSNYKVGNKITTSWTAADYGIVQETTYNSGDPYYKIRWLITNNGSVTKSNLRFGHGMDSFLMGVDSAYGFWDSATYSAGGERIDGGTILNRLVFQGFTVPNIYATGVYTTALERITSTAPTNYLDTSNSDHGYGLQWSRSTLLPGQTWSITATEKIMQIPVGSAVVLAPTYIEAPISAPFVAAFSVKNSTGSSYSTTLSLSTNQSGWSPVIVSPASPVIIASGATQEVLVQFQPPGGTADGTTGTITLSANMNSTMSTDTANIVAIVPVPSLTTRGISQISAISASSGGDILDDYNLAVTAKGVCWSTSPSPTIVNATCTNDGTGTSGYTSAPNGLLPSTMYYIRSYATNSAGTGYGNERTFTTLEATPTPTPTVTSTPTFTPTSTATPSWTPTLDPTPTHTSTPTVVVTSIPTIPPPAINTPSSQTGNVDDTENVTDKNGVSGNAVPNSSVKIYVNGKLIGTATSNSAGEYTLPFERSLLPGTYTIGALVTTADGLESAISTSELIVRSRTPLDFDGDGQTDIAMYQKSKNGSVEMQAVTSSDKRKRTLVVKGEMPAVADYDGDGKWDFGAVGTEKGNLSWTIKKSGTGKVETFIFGRSADRVLVGCRLNRKDIHSLATISGNVIQARTVSSRQVRKSRIRGSSLGSLLGCADITRDGLDEIIFSKPSVDRLQTTVQYYDVRRGQVESLVTLPRISSASVLEMQNGEPVIAFVNNTSARKAIKLFSPVGSTVSLDTFFASLLTDIIGGGVIRGNEIVDVFLSQNSGETVMNEITVVTWPEQSNFGNSEKGYRLLRQFSGR